MNSLRFSILEMLWICSVFATFLYFNLVMTPIQEGGVTISGKGITYYHHLESHTGWPLSYFSLRYEAPPNQLPIDASVDQIIAMEKTHASDIEHFPGYSPGMTRPKLTEVWSSGKKSWTIIINILLGLLASFMPLVALRVLKRLRERKRATTSAKPSVS